MRYLEWKKQIRKMYKEIEKELHIEKIELNLIKEHESGAHIFPRYKKITIPINQMKAIRKGSDYKYELIDITKVIIHHELGHYFQYMKDEESIGMKAERFQYLQKGIDLEDKYSEEEKKYFFKMHKKLTLEYEEEAWEIGSKFYKGNKQLFELLKEIGLKTYEEVL